MALLTPEGAPVAMTLKIQDPRSEEEKELDRQKEAEELTDPLPQVDSSQDIETG